MKIKRESLNRRGELNKLEVLLMIFVAVIFVLALFFAGKGITLVSELFTRLFVSLIYSIIAGAIVGTITGNFFEREIFKYEIIGIKFNIPVIVLVFIMKLLLF